MKKIIWIVIILLIIWGIVALGGDDNSVVVSDEPIKIGFSGSLTGPVAWLGELYLSGLRAAEKDINNDGGVQGRKIELIVEDNKFTGKGGVDSFRALQSKGADIILSLGTVPSVPMSPLAQDAEIPLLVSATFVDIPSENPYAIRMSILPDIDVDTTVIDMEKQGIKKVGILYMNNEYGVATLEAFRKRVEGSDISIVDEEGFLSDTPDFSTSVLKIVSNDIDAVYVVDLSFIRVMTELKQGLASQKKNIGVYLPASAYSSNNIAGNPELFEGVHVTVPIISIYGTKERNSFISKLGLEKSTNDALTHQAIGYDNLLAVVNVLKKNPDPKFLASEFEKFGHMSGATGEFELNSRNIGIPLLPAIFSNGELSLVE